MDVFTEGVRADRSEFATETRCRWGSDVEATYTLTTAGTTQQKSWRRIHGYEQHEDLGLPWCQAWTSSQLRLPQLIHGAELGEEVAHWAPHQLADHAAAATLIFTPTLLHVFLSLQVKLYLERGEVSGQTPTQEVTKLTTPNRGSIRSESDKRIKPTMTTRMTVHTLCMPPHA